MAVTRKQLDEIYFPDFVSAAQRVGIDTTGWYLQCNYNNHYSIKTEKGLMISPWIWRGTGEAARGMQTMMIAWNWAAISRDQ